MSGGYLNALIKDRACAHVPPGNAVRSVEALLVGQHEEDLRGQLRRPGALHAVSQRSYNNPETFCNPAAMSDAAQEPAGAAADKLGSLSVQDPAEQQQKPTVILVIGGSRAMLPPLPPPPPPPPPAACRLRPYACAPRRHRPLAAQAWRAAARRRSCSA